MAGLILKQGETFSIPCQYVDDDNAPKSLAGVTLSSQIRTIKNELIATLTIDVTDESAGEFILSADPSGTSLWSVGTHYLDIRHLIVDVIRITETVEITVETAQTLI